MRGLVTPASPASPAQHRLTPHFPYPSQCMRSGFALRPFPSHNAFSVQDFLPTLVKREDARSGCATSSLNSCLKPKHASQNHAYCHVERSRNISNQRRRKEHRTLLITKSEALSMEILHCAALRSERQQKGKVLQEKKGKFQTNKHTVTSHKLPVTKESDRFIPIFMVKRTNKNENRGIYFPLLNGRSLLSLRHLS